MEEVPGTVDGFPTIVNQGGVNEEGTADEMVCNSMRRDEVQYQLNDTEKSDISDIDILLQYWKRGNGNLMVWVTGLYTLGDDAIKAEDVKFD